MEAPEEFKKKIPNVTVGLIVFLCVISFVIGGAVTRLLDLDSELDNAVETINTTMREEINGLRADWDRDRTEQNKRIEKLDKIHTKE